MKESRSTRYAREFGQHYVKSHNPHGTISMKHINHGIRQSPKKERSSGLGGFMAGSIAFALAVAGLKSKSGTRGK